MNIKIDEGLARAIKQMSVKMNCSESQAVARLFGYGMLCARKLNEDGMLIVSSHSGRAKLEKDW